MESVSINNDEREKQGEVGKDIQKERIETKRNVRETEKEREKEIEGGLKNLLKREAEQARSIAVTNGRLTGGEGRLGLMRTMVPEWIAQSYGKDVRSMLLVILTII